MTDCDNIAEKLPLYALGELDENEKQEIEAHIKSCKNCRNFCAEIKSIVLALKNMDDIEVSEDIHNKIMDEIKKINYNKKKIKFKESLFTAACFIFMCIVTVALYDIQNKKALEEAEISSTVRQSADSVIDYEKKDKAIIYESLTLSVKSNDINAILNTAKYYDPEAYLNGSSINFKILKQDLELLMQELNKISEAEITDRKKEDKTEQYNKITAQINSADKSEDLKELAEQAFFMEMDSECFFIKINIKNL